MSEYGKGIPIAVGFDLGAQKPLDNRLCVKTIEERDANVINNRAYVGMIVYVEQDGLTYQYNGATWDILPTKEYIDEAIKNVEVDIEEVDLSSYVSKEEFEQNHIPISTGELDALINDIFNE